MGSPPAADTVEFGRTVAAAASALFGDAHEFAVPSVGRFELSRPLGRGGMGSVYEAHDPKLDRVVAIKVLHVRTGDGDEQARLLAEARAAARVEHPNVVKVYEAGVDEGRVYIVMERVHGTDLHAWVERRQPSWRELVRLFTRVGRGLEAVHAAGLVHRDFKPSNVLVSEIDGRPEPRVVDFGLAGRAGADARMGGTWAYMAPEQLTGEGVDAAADQYAFFLSLFEALTRRQPPRPEQREISALLEARRVWLEAGRSPPGPSSLRRALRRGTAVDAARRFAGMGEAVAALERVLVGVQRRRLLAATCGVGLVGAVALGLVAYDPCENADAGWAQTYDDDARARVRARLEEVAPTYGARSSGAIDRAFEEWGAEWSRSRRQSCRAAPPGRWPWSARDDAPSAAVDACLDRRLLDAAAVLRRLEQIPRDAAPDAATAVANLPTPRGCLSRTGTGGTASGPLADVDALDVATTAMSRARAHVALVEYEPALEALDEAAALRGPGAPPELRLEAEILEAVVRTRLGEAEQARGGLEDAVYEAIEHGLDALANRAATELIWTDGYVLRRLEAAERWNALAAAHEARAGLAGAATARRLDKFGAALYRSGEYARALEIHEQALDMAREIWGPEHPALFTHLLHAGSAASRVKGRHQDAVAYNADALALAERTFGPRHPTVALAINNRPLRYDDPDECRAYIPALARALEIKREAYGPRSLKLPSSLNNLANCQGLIGDHASAIDNLDQAIDIIEANSDPTDPRIGIYAGNMARSYIELGTPEALDDAEAAFERSLAVQRAAFGDDHWELLYPLVGLLDVDLEHRQVVDGDTRSRLAETARLTEAGDAGDDAIVAMAYMDHARAARLDSDLEAARSWCARAEDKLERVGSSPILRAKFDALCGGIDGEK